MVCTVAHRRIIDKFDETPDALFPMKRTLKNIKSSHPSYQADSGWNQMLAPRRAQTHAPSQRQFDVIVVGAGFTGLAAARRIAEIEPESSILVVDAAQVGEGSGGRNSGFLINLPHNTGMSGHGAEAEAARKQIHLYNIGLDWLGQIVRDHRIECGWNPAGKYHAAATAEGERRLLATLEQYRQWGVSYRELDRTDLASELGTAYYRYGYHSANNVFVQPAALVRGLADSLPDNVQMWEKEPVIRLDGSGPYEVQTASATLKARRVIVANNGFARKLGLARDRVLTIYTYAALTPVLDDTDLASFGSQGEWGVIPANRMGSTLRRTGQGRFMVRSAFSYETEQPLAGIKDLLTDCYRRRFPHMPSHAFEYVWGGVTALTRNGAVYFGEVKKDMFVSLGCNGAGILKGSMFGKLLGEMACGQQSPELTIALGLERPTWLPPEPIRRVAVLSAIQYQKRIAGLER
jgi:glycine/D-amino acid oxidase-like deaminating enzyme